MSVIKFRAKDKWITCDFDGTIKLFRVYPERDGLVWKGKGGQILAPEHTTGISIKWNDEPLRVIEHRALEICDFNII